MNRWRCPPWIGVLMMTCRSFSSRRRVLQFWCWSESGPLPLAIRNAVFRLRRPIFSTRCYLLRRRLEALHARGLGLLVVNSGMVL